MSIVYTKDIEAWIIIRFDKLMEDKFVQDCVDVAANAWNSWVESIQFKNAGLMTQLEFATKSNEVITIQQEQKDKIKLYFSNKLADELNTEDIEELFVNEDRHPIKFSLIFEAIWITEYGD